MRLLQLLAPGFLAITAAAVCAHAGHTQAPANECARLSNGSDDAAPLAAELAAAAKNAEPSRLEEACREALAADPVNPSLMFQLGRALSLASKPLEAIKRYLDAADRGHAGAMNDLGGVFEYGIGVQQNMATALV